MLTPYCFIPMAVIILTLAPAFAIDQRPRPYWAIVPLTILAMLLRRPPHNVSPVQPLSGMMALAPGTLLILGSALW